MRNDIDYLLRPIGFIESSLQTREEAPSQGEEGAPEAWVRIDKRVAEGLDGIVEGQQVILLTWFHKSSRDVLKLHPRWDKNNPLTGVFATRSPDRPNPIGLHTVTVRKIEENAILVFPLEAIDGTPVIDIKPVL